ncbi:WD40-repeat-containing domain protein [Globomyces pollinis-pini]|nr:WD40-repeat-containing domain protein [Globomyces pollinis-pini]
MQVLPSIANPLPNNSFNTQPEVQTPINEFNTQNNSKLSSSTIRRKRGGWGSNLTNPDKVKEFIRSKKIQSTPPDTPCKMKSGTSSEFTLYESSNSQNRPITPDLPPAAEEPKLDKPKQQFEQKNSSRSRVASKQAMQDAKLKPISRKSSKLPWNSEFNSDDIQANEHQSSLSVLQVNSSPASHSKNTVSENPIDKLLLNQFHADLSHCIADIQNAQNIVKEYTRPETNQPAQLTAIEVLKYMISHNMEESSSKFVIESKIPSKTYHKLQLKHLIGIKEFGKSIVLVQTLMANESYPKSFQPSCEDLIYVLCKYLFIHLYENQQTSIAERTLKMVIWPLVQKEQKRGGVRCEWFTQDYHLLDNLISDRVSDTNIYKSFKWEVELGKFWNSIVELNQKNSSPPLFAYALDYFFNDGSTVDSSASHSPIHSDFKSDALKIQETLTHIEHRLTKVTNHKLFRVDLKSNQNRRLPPSRPQSSNRLLEDSSIKTSHTLYSKNQTSTHTAIKSQFDPYEMQNVDDCRPMRKTVAKSEISNSTDRSRATNKYLAEQLPPVSNEQENSNFALSFVCGPTSGQVRVMDITTIPETGQIIAATSSDEKGISIWDIQKNNLIHILNNNSIKPIVCLAFHPAYPELLLAADMEFDVKLWNWKDQSLVRWWKKHHSRIIYQIGYIPGDDTRAITCSGDQSLKIWNIHSDKTHRGSLHANEPITSFVLCGSPTDECQQKIIASLSYSIRIYKLRTLQLLHTITLSNMKLTKSSINFMNVHPKYDNYILLSSDHQLRLFDLTTETVVKTYSTRSTSTEMHLKGYISPCGNYIYSGTCNPKYNSTQTPDTNLTGCLLWKLHDGKLEHREMQAMQDTNEFLHQGAMLDKIPVLDCKWVNRLDKSRKPSGYQKILVSIGLDNLLRLHI